MKNRHRLRLFLLYAAGGLAAALAVLVLIESAWATPATALTHFTLLLAGLVLAIGLPALLIVGTQIGRVFHALERLRGFIVTMQTDAVDTMPAPLPGSLPVEVQRLLDAIDGLIGGRLEQQALPVRQLEEVLGSIPDAIIVVSHSGLVGLVNEAAQRLLGEEALAVGTSIYDAVSSSDLEAALAAARTERAPAPADLTVTGGRVLRARVATVGENRGAVLVFEPSESVSSGDVHHALHLLDSPPTPGKIGDDTSLADLPVFVFDLETTGLDVARDRPISIGGVRLHGGTIYRAATIDRLVNPGLPIPPRSTAIHGITDDMVAGAGSFQDIWTDIEPLMQGVVLVGHNVGFDIAHMRSAAARADIAWSPPEFLCTYLLAAALDLGLPSLGLDSLAGALGVQVRGRHTALGDALVTAEVFARLIPRLADAGVTTLGAARTFARRRRDLLKQQTDAGWWTVASR